MLDCKLARFRVYIDVEWVGDCECQRFMFDYLFILGMSHISWSAKKQPSIATS